MKYSGVLITVFGACILILSIACRQSSPGKSEQKSPSFSPGPYNLVLVSLDTLRAGHLGAYGYQRATSPNFDQLARNSILFRDCEAQAPHTRPSHRSMFQSRYPSFCGNIYPMLAEILHSAGYHTEAFTDGGHVAAKMGFGRGFDSYRDSGGGFARNFPLAASWLKNHPPEPFFLFFHSYDIHAPYDPPAPFDTMFTDPKYNGPIYGQETRQLIWKIRHRKQYRDLKENIEVPPEDRAQLEALYDGGIAYSDQYLAKLVTVLKGQKLWESTVLIVFSDHGEEFWDHGSVSHGHTLYEELLRVVLLIHLPGDAYGGTRVDSMVRLLDLSPTILELLGMDPQESHQGRRLIPELLTKSAGQAASPPSFAEKHTLKSVRRGKWKFILNIMTGKAQLFDLEIDPAEKHSLTKEKPKIVKSMAAELRRTYGALENSGIDTDQVAREVTDKKIREQLRALGYIE